MLPAEIRGAAAVGCEESRPGCAGDDGADGPGGAPSDGAFREQQQRVAMARALVPEFLLGRMSRRGTWKRTTPANCWTCCGGSTRERGQEMSVE